MEEPCCRGIPSAPAPPLEPITHESRFTVELCQDRDLGCLTAHRQVGQVEDIADGIEGKDQRIPFQIFPEPVEVVLATQPCTVNQVEQEKERLPSIVVEPTEVSEVESGELRWPPENSDLDEDEEDLFLEQCIPPANIADWGEEEEEEEETSVIFNPHPGLTLIDLQSDAFRDDTPTLPPSNASAFN